MTVCLILLGQLSKDGTEDAGEREGHDESDPPGMHRDGLHVTYGSWRGHK